MLILVSVLAEATKHVSKSLWVNERLVQDSRAEIKVSDFVDEHIVIVRVGSRQHVVLYIERE